jgi:hypothetical protein
MNKKYIILLSIGVLIGFISSYFIFKETKEYINVPIKIEVPVPVIEEKFDTIYLPSKIKNNKPIIDSTYYKKYINLKTSIEKDSAYKEAITINEYRPTFEDKNIKIDVYSKVRGELLENQISYKTKPRNIIVDTIIKIPVPKKSELYVGGEVVLPTNPIIAKTPSIIIGGAFVNKNHNKIYTGGYDFINKSAKVGILFRL